MLLLLLLFSEEEGLRWTALPSIFFVPGEESREAKIVAALVLVTEETWRQDAKTVES